MAEKRRTRRWLVVLAVALVIPLLWWFGMGRPVAYGTLTGVLPVGDSTVPGVRYEEVALATSSGRTLRCMVRSPTGQAPGVRRPALLVAGGHRTGRRAVRYLGAAFAGTAIACDYQWAPRIRRSWPLVALGFPSIRAELVATPDVLRIASAYLMTRTDVDTTRFAGVGASLGVPLVAAWASRDTVPRAVALVYGGGLIDRQIEIEADEGHLWPWLGRLLGGLAGKVFADLEPTRTVPGIAPRPVLVIGSRDDQRVPVEGVQALFDAAGDPKKIIWLGGTHLRPRDEELLQILADSSLVWLEEVLPARWREP
ncbi:MAG: alpha/beta hydrolase [Gemmatimonadota bacterium]